MDILEMQRGNNLDLATYTFEAYGYFWDRAAMETPGGPRHPGSA
jgi:succinate-acetate transporter protein